MPWMTETPVTLRQDFIRDVKRGHLSFSEVCERYRISRKTGYKWYERNELTGPEGLEDRSRRPDSHPNQTPSQVVKELLRVRRERGWGARKVLQIVGERHPSWKLPHLSTVYDIFRREGVAIKKRRRHRRPGHPGRPTTKVTGPNQVWSADFKGQFRMGNGEYCYPLTLTDNHSRFLLCCQGLRSTNLDDTKAVMEKVFREYGLPERIKTDNGAPFASEALGRLSRLSAWWLSLGIKPELIEPGRPEQNGRHERMHRTLKEDTTRPPGSGLRSQQRKFDEFTRTYNFERPHESLNLKTPADFYQKSTRKMPSKPGVFQYPGHYEVRLVSGNGGIRWNNQWVNVSSVIMGEHVGLEFIEHGIWNVYYRNFLLGRLHEKHGRIEDNWGRLARK